MSKTMGFFRVVRFLYYCENHVNDASVHCKSRNIHCVWIALAMSFSFSTMEGSICLEIKHQSVRGKGHTFLQQRRVHYVDKMRLNLSTSLSFCRCISPSEASLGLISKRSMSLDSVLFKWLPCVVVFAVVALRTNEGSSVGVDSSEMRLGDDRAGSLYLDLWVQFISE